MLLLDWSSLLFFFKSQILLDYKKVRAIAANPSLLDICYNRVPRASAKALFCFKDNFKNAK